jgi:hypothetical protein
MKSFFQHFFVQAMLIVLVCFPALCVPNFGFSLPESMTELTLRYKTVGNLILLPVVINDSIKVNLVLDTGCRNLVLFGKKFQNLFNIDKKRKVMFSGLGSGDPIYGFLSLSNRVVISQVIGERIPVVVVPSKNVWKQYSEIHGVIGYDILVKFEIELNPKKQTITFRPANLASAPVGFNVVGLKIVDSRPVMNSDIQLDGNSKSCELMIDTGSSLGLLLKTTSIEDYSHLVFNQVMGFGFNGPLSGYTGLSEKLTLDTFEILDLPTGIVESPWHNYASIGMDVLKDYVFVLNYCKAYAGFRAV